MQSKWIGTSLTIWGAIMTALSSFGPVFGPLIGLDIQPSEINQLGTTGTQLIQATGSLIGLVMVVVGRIRAKGPATVLPNKSA